MAYRRSALEAVGGFDERFPRAYREDADLALRVRRAGYRLVRGDRLVLHPAADAGPWASVRAQAGNADDALMLVLHGPGWRRTAEAPRGRRPAHLHTTAAGLMAVAGAARGRRGLAATGALAWIGATGELAWRRVGPGPRTGREVARMLATTPLIPPAATLHWLVGLGRALALRRAGPWGARDGRGAPGGRPLEAVLLDRDGTLVADVAYNGDPSRVRPMAGARRALDRLRRAGLRLAVVSNQSGIARGLLTPSGVEAVNRRVEDLLGPFDGWFYCPHGPADGCPCRKPAPGLVLAAARALGVRPERCAVVGDTAADVGAARAVGARAILVPTPATRGEEARAAPELAADLEAAADRLVGSAVPG
jgi:histidinol-phosphate phosphatase family protein